MYNNKCKQQTHIKRKVIHIKNFNWELFKKDKFAAWCKKVEEKLDFLQECEDCDFEWFGGSKSTQLTYSEDEEFEEIPSTVLLETLHTLVMKMLILV